VLASDSSGNLFIIPDKSRPKFGPRGIIGGFALGTLILPILYQILGSTGMV